MDYAVGRPDLLEVANFGDISAEHDTLLGTSFVITNSYTSIARDLRYIVLGRKGAGKTALYQALQTGTELTDSRVVGLDLVDYPWQLHNDALNAAGSPRERHVNSWLFLMLVEIARLALRDAGPGDAQRALREFIEANWGRVEFSFRDFYRRETYELRAELRPTVAGFSLGSLERRPASRSRLGETIGPTLDWLERVVAAALDARKTYLVAFDGLDLVYGSDSDYADHAIGLLLAAQRVARWAERSNVRVRAVVFIRRDIFDGLRFSEKNKLRVGASTTISWSAESDGPDNLLSLMRKRIRSLFPDVPRQLDPWQTFFPKAQTVTIKPNDPQWPRESLYRYMSRRTLRRPRDMIHFANLALERAKNRIRSGRGSAPFVLAPDVTRSLPAFSRFLLAELDDEIGVANPGWRDVFEVVRWIGRAEFSGHDFEQRISDLREAPMAARDALELLYSVGVLGFTSDAYPRPTFVHDEGEVVLDPRASTYFVHPGFLGVFGDPYQAAALAEGATAT